MNSSLLQDSCVAQLTPEAGAHLMQGSERLALLGIWRNPADELQRPRQGGVLFLASVPTSTKPGLLHFDEFTGSAHLDVIRRGIRLLGVFGGELKINCVRQSSSNEVSISTLVQ